MIASLLLAAQTVASGPGASAPPPAIAPAAVPPAQHAAAEELVRIARIDEVMQAASAKQVALLRSGTQISAQLDQNPVIRLQRAKNPQAWDAAIARIAAKEADAYQGLINAMQPAARDQAVRAYETNFTLAELRELAAFYRTPLGQTVVARTPVVTEQTMLWMQRELPQRLAPIIAALQPEIARELAPLMPQPSPPPPTR